MKAILFDFGGTIDTDGIHWSEKFWHSYQPFNLPLSKAEFEDAYRYSEKKMKSIVHKNDGMYTMLYKQYTEQMKYLVKEHYLSYDPAMVTKLTDNSYADVVLSTEKAEKVFKKLLEEKYSLGIVSNFTGNLIAVLQGLHIDGYFSAVVDSAVAGYEKPGIEIYKHAAKMLKSDPKDICMVGDSYSRDIQPAKKLGCFTVWLNGISWEKVHNPVDADIIISSLEDLPGKI
jgi:FMN hydrolase / 5-amino-6-(5-phospho-D-ribitylamino)uracil phosphatase